MPLLFLQAVDQLLAKKAANPSCVGPALLPRALLVQAGKNEIYSPNSMCIK